MLRPLPLLLLCLTLAPLLAGCASPGTPRTEPIGLSRDQRPIEAATIGHGPRRVYLIGAIHGDEPEGLASLDQIQQTFHDRFAADVTLRLVRDMNPDGTAARSRTNKAGIDLNRNWPAANFRTTASRGHASLSEPEAAALHADITRFDPHLIVVLHSIRSGPFVNHDGPESAGALARQFVAAAKAIDPRWRVVADMGYPTPGSMGSYFGVDRDFPILTIELKRGDGPETVTAPLIAGLAAAARSGTLAMIPLSRTELADRSAPDVRAEPAPARRAR